MRNNAFRLTVFGEHKDASTDRIPIVVQNDLLTIYSDIALQHRNLAEQGASHFGPSGSDQTCQTENLTTPDQEIESFGETSDSHVRHLQPDNGVIVLLRPFVERFRLASQHVLNEMSFVGLGYWAYINQLSVAEHCDSITYLEYFLQMVRYIDDGFALLCKTLDYDMQPFDFHTAERRSWLIHHYDIELTGQRPRNLNQLLVTNGQRRYITIHTQIKAKITE